MQSRAAEPQLPAASRSGVSVINGSWASKAVEKYGGFGTYTVGTVAPALHPKGEVTTSEYNSLTFDSIRCTILPKNR